MGEKWVNYTFRKYQFFLMNPKKKIQEKAECNIRVNKFRKSFFFWLMVVWKTLPDPLGNLRKLIIQLQKPEVSFSCAIESIP